MRNSRLVWWLALDSIQGKVNALDGNFQPLFDSNSCFRGHSVPEAHIHADPVLCIWGPAFQWRIFPEPPLLAQSLLLLLKSVRRFQFKTEVPVTSRISESLPSFLSVRFKNHLLVFILYCRLVSKGRTDSLFWRLNLCTRFHLSEGQGRSHRGPSEVSLKAVANGLMVEQETATVRVMFRSGWQCLLQPHCLVQAENSGDMRPTAKDRLGKSLGRLLKGPTLPAIPQKGQIITNRKAKTATYTQGQKEIRWGLMEIRAGTMRKKTPHLILPVVVGWGDCPWGGLPVC